MFRLIVIIAAVFFMAACTTSSPVWRDTASMAVEELGRQEAAKLFPQEYNNVLETFEHGEAVLHVHDNQGDADAFYLLALQKSAVLRAELKAGRERKAAAEAEAEQRARDEKARLQQEAADAVARLAEQEQERLRKDAQERKAARARQNVIEPTLVLPLVYTVHRGETLPQIAARTEIYDNASLWPLIYRANRDQIRNPRQLWPGQKLKIPRNFSRDEVTEAKRFSGRK